MKKVIRNGEIEFWRGIFCLVIFLYHLSLDSDSSQTLFQKGQIGVEFFFLVSGLFMAKTVDNRREKGTDGLGKESFMYVLHKYAVMFPYHAAAFLAGFALLIKSQGWALLECFEKALLVMPQFLLLHMSGIGDIKVVTIEWYLSAMLIGMLFIYPLLRKWYDVYVYIVGTLLSLSIFGYMYTNVGHLLRKEVWTGVTTAAVLRAVAIMNLGCLAYEIAKMIRKQNWTGKGRLCLSLVCLAGYGITLYYAASAMDEKVRFTLVFLLMVSIAVSYSGSNSYGKYLDRDVFRFVGKISLPFYLNTNIVRFFMQSIQWNQWRYRYFIIMGVLINFLLSSAMVIAVEKIKKWKAA